MSRIEAGSYGNLLTGSFAPLSTAAGLGLFKLISKPVDNGLDIAGVHLGPDALLASMLVTWLTCGLAATYMDRKEPKLSLLTVLLAGASLLTLPSLSIMSGFTPVNEDSYQNLFGIVNFSMAGLFVGTAAGRLIGKRLDGQSHG